MGKGVFITFEGGEGAGKSTQLALLEKAFQKAGLDALVTREPGGTPEAEDIRNLLVTGDTDKWDAMTETLLHLAARRNHVKKKIAPALDAGKWVISDRFQDSTQAYQGFGHELGDVTISTMYRIVLEHFTPNLTFIFDIDVEQGIKRAAERRGNEDRYENMDINFHHRVREGFLAIARQDKDRCVVVRAAESIEHIHHKIINTINERFGTSLEEVA